MGPTGGGGGGGTTTVNLPGHYYVTKAGVDAPTRGGTQSDPFLTIAYAISRASSGNTIHIGPGTFAEKLHAASGKNLTFIGSGSSGTNVTAIGGIVGQSVHVEAAGTNISAVKFLKPQDTTVNFLAHITGTSNLSQAADVDSIIFNDVDFGSTESNITKGVSVNTAGVRFENCKFPTTLNYSLGIGSGRGVDVVNCTFPAQPATAWGNIGIFPSAQVPVGHAKRATARANPVAGPGVDLFDPSNNYPADCVIQIQPTPYASLGDVITAGVVSGVAPPTNPGYYNVLLPEAFKYKHYLKLNTASGELSLNTAQAAALAATALSPAIYGYAVANWRMFSNTTVKAAADTQAAQVVAGYGSVRTAAPSLSLPALTGSEYVRTNLATGLGFTDSGVIVAASAADIASAAATFSAGDQVSLGGSTWTVAADATAATEEPVGTQVVVDGAPAIVASVTSIGAQILSAASTQGAKVVIDTLSATFGDEAVGAKVLDVALPGALALVEDAASGAKLSITPPSGITMALNIKEQNNASLRLTLFATNASGVRQTTFPSTSISLILPEPAYSVGQSVDLYHLVNGVGQKVGTATATMSGSDLVVTYPITSNSEYQAQSSSEPAPQCFLGDAPVLTAKGYRRIDSLRAGDLVKTASGRLVAIREVLVRSYAPGRTTNPYVIPAGMFGARERLYISPNHKVAVAGRGMVEARELGLRQWTMREEITYYNLELEAHENMIVAGVEVESLAPIRQVEVSAAQFKAMVAKLGPMTPALAAKLARTCAALPGGRMLVPVMKKTA